MCQGKKITLAKECMISDRTSESGSVPMDFMRASHMKCHIWVRYSGPRTRAHSSSRGMDSAAATRTRETVKETPNTFIKPYILFSQDELLNLRISTAFTQKDIIVEVKLEERNHQLHHLLCVLHKTLLQLFGITHLEHNTERLIDTDETPAMTLVSRCRSTMALSVLPSGALTNLSQTPQDPGSLAGHCLSAPLL